MKIGIVCYPTFGGSGVLATELGLGLAKKGHQVHFITYRTPFRLTSFQENVFYHEVGELNYPLFEYAPYESTLASKMVDVVLHEDLDILHVHYAVPHASVAYMAKKILLLKGKYIPIVTTLHGTDITLVGQDPGMAPVVSFSINKSDGVTAVSHSLKADTEAAFEIKNEIKVIHNFIDLNRFQRHNKDHFKQAIAPNGERILIHVSNFRKVKRVEDVIKMFALVNKEIPSTLLMIGDGPERYPLERLCREMGLCDRIRFLGKQEAVEELLAISDIFVMPSESESFGLAGLEAMACQVPVVSSDVGGITEVNIDGVTGYVSKVGDVESMAKNALSILSSEEELAKFRKGARAQAERFSLDNILPQYENYYKNIIEKKVFVKSS